MRFLRLIPAFFLIASLAGCDQKPDQVYTPPSLSGKAYVLADGADHIVIGDLATTALSRIKMDKQALDLAIVNKQLYVLAADGTLATLASDNTLGPWQEGLAGAVAMSAGPGNTLWLLGKTELKQYVPGQGPGKTVAIAGDYSSLFPGEGEDTVWLVSRQKSTATPFNPTTAQTGAPVAMLGNSIHHGRIFPGANELWIAEGNEYMNGEPYGVGYAVSGPAMPGGINVIDLKTGVQSDFILVGGNVVDLAIDPSQQKAYAAVSQLPDYNEATVSVIDTKHRRGSAEMRLCQPCHLEQNVPLKKGQGLVKALAIAPAEETKK